MLKGLAISIPFGTSPSLYKTKYAFKKYLPVELTKKDASTRYIGILLEFPKVEGGESSYERVLLRIAPSKTNIFAYNPYTVYIGNSDFKFISDLLHVQGHLVKINEQDYNIYYYAILDNKIYVMDNDFSGYSMDAESKQIIIMPTKTLFNDAEGGSIKNFTSFDNIKITLGAFKLNKEQGENPRLSQQL